MAARKCSSGKVAFRSQGEARRALARIALTEQQAAVHVETFPQSAYRCRCGAWHLTSQEQRTKPPRAKKGREVADRRPRRRPRRKGPALSHAPAAIRHLTAVPAARAKQPEPAPRFEASGPITPARRDLWRTRAEELARANAQSRNTFPWRNQAA